MIRNRQSSRKKAARDERTAFGDTILRQCDGCNDGRPVVLWHRWLRLALHRILDDRREPLGLALRTLLLALLEFRQNFLAEHVERAADILVLVVARLRDEHDLIDAHLLVLAQTRANLIGRADARGMAAEPRHLHRVALEIAPDVGLADFVPPEEIMMAERVGEKVQSLLAHRTRALLVAVAHEAGHDRDVGIDRVPDRLTFVSE